MAETWASKLPDDIFEVGHEEVDQVYSQNQPSGRFVRVRATSSYGNRARRIVVGMFPGLDPVNSSHWPCRSDCPEAVVQSFTSLAVAKPRPRGIPKNPL